MSTDFVVIFDGDLPNTLGPHSSVPRSATLSADALALASEVRILDQVHQLYDRENNPAGWVLVRQQQEPVQGIALVVEDNAETFGFYHEVLSSVGLEVVGAGSIEQASRVVQDKGAEIAVALIDVRLPDGNGFELTRQFTSDPALDFPIVITSADASLADPDAIETVGAVGFIENPIDARTLAQSALSHARSASINTARVVPASTPSADFPLRFFGRPAVLVDGAWIPLRRGRSVELLATLVSAAPAAVSPERLARYAWAGEEEASTNAVYTAISRLRNWLTEVGAGDLVLTEGSGYYLGVEAEDVDVIAFENDARKAIAKGAELEVDELREVLSRWTGPVFVGTKNPVLQRWSQRIDETRARLMDELAHSLVASGDYEDATEICEELLRDEPWREAIWLVLIVALYRAGRTNDSLQRLSTCKTLLRTELGLEPGPALSEIELFLLTHDPRLGQDEWLRGHTNRAFKP